MLNLIPRYVLKYQDYWESITKYNQWFIQLRFYAIIALVIFLIFLRWILQVELTQLQIMVLSGSALTIYFYNVYFKRISERYTSDKQLSMGTRFTPLHFAFTQIIVDLISLGVIVYYLGGIEAPIFMFFLFHMIIGSLILPERIIYFIAITLILVFSLLTSLEYFYIIPHQEIIGLYSAPFYDDPNFIIAFLSFFAFMVCIAIHLTNKIARELYAREGQVKLALDHVNEAEESKQKYIMAVVHELKSPIAGASSQLEIVSEGFAGEIAASAKDKVEKANKRLLEAIDNINNILRVSKFKLLNSLEKENIDLKKFISKISENLQSNAQRKKIKLETEFITDKLITEADPVLMHLAFSNLIGNAVKYTPENGQVKINLTTQADQIIIKISDNGIGIPQKELDKIFDDFFRASNAKANKIEGTGTGLAAVKNIIDAHQGSIKVTSPSKLQTKGRPGTEFKICIKNLFP